MPAAGWVCRPKIEPEDSKIPKQDPEDKKKMMLQMHDGAVVHTVRGPLRDGKQRGMAGVSKVWDAAGGQASGSKKGDSKKTTRNQNFFFVILAVSMLVNSRNERQHI